MHSARHRWPRHPSQPEPCWLLSVKYSQYIAHEISTQTMVHTKLSFTSKSSESSRWSIIKERTWCRNSVRVTHTFAMHASSWHSNDMPDSFVWLSVLQEVLIQTYHATHRPHSKRWGPVKSQPWSDIQADVTHMLVLHPAKKDWRNKYWHQLHSYILLRQAFEPVYECAGLRISELEDWSTRSTTLETHDTQQTGIGKTISNT